MERRSGLSARHCAYGPPNRRSRGDVCPALMLRRLSGVGRALRAGIADRPEHVLDSGGGLVRRDAGRRMLAGEFEGADARMRIGPVPHPAVLLAFPDSADLDQNRRRHPSAVRKAGRRSFIVSIEFAPEARETNPLGRPPFRAANTGQGFGIAGTTFSTRVLRLSSAVARSWKP